MSPSSLIRSLLTLASIGWIILGACSTTSKPGVALQDVLVDEGPYIVQRSENFYLRYRLAVGPDERPALRMVVGVKKTKDKAFYFFIGPISYPERGNTIERPLASDGLTEFARHGTVYWLNPDGSEKPLDIRERPRKEPVARAIGNHKLGYAPIGAKRGQTTNMNAPASNLGLSREQSGTIVLADRCAKLTGAEASAAFLFASYLFGHLVFLLGSRLDEFYDWARRYTLNPQVACLVCWGRLTSQSSPCGSFGCALERNRAYD